MEEKKFLNEEKYQKTKKKITRISLIILIVGVIIGGGLITTGLMKQSKVNSQYSEESKTNISQQLEIEKQNIIKTKTELEGKIKPVEDQIKALQREPFTGFNDEYYARQDKIEELEKSITNDKTSIEVIDDALDESFNHCKFNEAKNNVYTSKYCSLKLQLDDISNDFNKSFDSHGSIPFYMFGAFIIIASGMISFVIYMYAKRREVLAFGAQSVVPVAKEVVEDVAPTIGKAGKTIAKELAPGLGSIAKEVSQGIKSESPSNENNQNNNLNQ